MKEAVLITSGDMRHSANRVCWPAQQELEQKLGEIFLQNGVSLRRAFPFDPELEHGFNYSQRMGMDIFRHIDPDAPLVFATAAWQYSHHVLPGMRSHRGPMLTIANWSGQWPGLVGLLNLNGSLTKAGVAFSTLWSERFEDEFFLNGLKQWIDTGKVVHDLAHVRGLQAADAPAAAVSLGSRLAEELLERKVILGVFDEGCMGMYNAIIDDELLNPAGFFKERLSQSALMARMRTVKEDEARAVREWLEARGFTFHTGKDSASQLTNDQILEQCKMYVAAVRMAKEFACDAIGIQYQQGLKDMAPASDLVEGLLNNPDRPPVYDEAGGEELYAGKALPHFNEVDECAGVDAVVTNLCWMALGMDPSTTLHDVRWGEQLEVNGKSEFVWVFQISGAGPASHFVDGYNGASSERQPAMYFPLGGGTLKGVGRPGPIVWSRVFVEAGRLQVDMGLGSVVELSARNVERRWQNTTREWPLVNAVLSGISRDQLMARHRANHISIAYAATMDEARSALFTKAAMFSKLGVEVHLCGEIRA